MIWLVSGSRDFPDEALARAIFRAQFKAGDFLYHGGARGVDTWAKEEAMKVDLQLMQYIPNWDRGKSAGPRRNVEMFNAWRLNHEPKHALILWDGRSRGTKHTLDLVSASGIPYTLIQLRQP